MGRTRKYDIWEHFVPKDSDGIVVDMSKATKAQCTYCEWSQKANMTRMKLHYDSCHAPGKLKNEVTIPPYDDFPNEEAHLVVAPVPPLPPAAKKQKTLHGFVERKFTPAEQANAEMAQAFALVMNGHSYSAQP